LFHDRRVAHAGSLSRIASGVAAGGRTWQPRTVGFDLCSASDAHILLHGGRSDMRHHGLVLPLLLSAACTGMHDDAADSTDESRPVTGDKHLFVTSTTYQGGVLGGLAGADAKCAERAAIGGLLGTYKAWLSDTHKSAASRLTRSSGTYSLVD